MGPCWEDRRKAGKESFTRREATEDFGESHVDAGVTVQALMGT